MVIFKLQVFGVFFNNYVLKSRARRSEGTDTSLKCTGVLLTPVLQYSCRLTNATTVYRYCLRPLLNPTVQMDFVLHCEVLLETRHTHRSQKSINIQSA